MASVAGCPYYLIFPGNVLAKRRQPQDKVVAIGIGRGKEAHCLRMTLMNQHYQCCYNLTYFYVLKSKSVSLSQYTLLVFCKLAAGGVTEGVEWPEGHGEEKQVHKTISRVSHNLCLLTYFDAAFTPFCSAYV